ncbi:hypothetical protein D4Z93_07500 [Clostridium fermenticellae]|uniref:YprB ribonuclease H-like domain-containing protein n=1 Tax=Clostridium fermenticellae TaxID=2068654 RepID=A0A386H3Z7_9CLOT|nr:hypothetical protein D4Z93_07500 [Clostridium fermenticellae]
MIERHTNLSICSVSQEDSLVVDGKSDLFKNAVFFDLEHYIYKKPICIGVFGCCYLNNKNDKLEVTQYMIENKKDAHDIVFMAKKYFKRAFEEHNKRYIVTFSGNNDFTVIGYLFKQNNIEFDFNQYFRNIDIQKEYEKERKICIGLKALEKEFNIIRDTEVISGSNLAKTFSKIIKDDTYIDRMPYEKKDKILLYNQQDVVSLFDIFIHWNSIMKKDTII